MCFIGGVNKPRSRLRCCTHFVGGYRPSLTGNAVLLTRAHVVSQGLHSGHRTTHPMRTADLATASARSAAFPRGAVAYVYVCVYINIFIHTHTHTCVHVYIYMPICIYAYIYIYIYIHTHTHTLVAKYFYLLLNFAL